MKKRVLLLISVLILAFASAFTFVACGGKNDSEGRRTEADGVYYLYRNDALDTETSITVSRGKITAATGENMSGLDEFLGTSGSKTAYSGSVSGNSVTWTITVTITDPTSRKSVKAVFTSTGEYNNGVMHFTSMSGEVTLDGEVIESMSETECDVWYCKEGKTPDNLNGGDTPGPDDPVNPSRPTNTSFDTASQITLGTEYNVSIPNSGELYYSFTPTEAGIYSIASKDYSGDPQVFLYDSQRRELANDDDDGDNYNFRLVRELEAGATYYLSLGRTGSAYKFSITKLEIPANTTLETASPIVLGTQYSADLSYVEELWYSFTPTESNTYVIESTDYNSGNPYVTLCDSQGGSITSNDDGGTNRNFKLVYAFEAGRTYYLSMGNSGSRYKFSVTTLPNSTRADASVITNITTGIDVSFVAQNQKIWYSFTPATSGTYKFTANSSYNSVALYRGDETSALATHETSSGNSVSLNLSCALEAGTTYYLCFQNKSSSSSYTYSVDVTLCDGASRETALVASLDTPHNVNIVSGGADVWFVFRPTVRNRYIIQSSNSTDDPFCELYTNGNSSATANDDNGAGGVDFRLVRVLEANTNYYICASMASSIGTGHYVLTVTTADGTSVETAIVAATDTDYSVAPASATPIWLEFTAPVSGEYTIRSTGSAGDPSCELYSNVNNSPLVSDDNSGSGNNFSMSCSLTSGYTYYVKVMQQSVTAVACTVRIETPVGATRENPIVAVLGTEYTVNKNSSNENTWFAYTPTVTGVYVMRNISYSGDPDCALYENEDAEPIATDTGSSKFIIRRQLTAGNTYYIRAYHATSYTFMWSMADGSDRETAAVTAVNTPYTVSISDADQEVWYVFTPQTSGSYRLYSTAVGSCDPACYIYSGTSTSSMAHDDDSGNGRNFDITVNLNSGSTYYIGLKVTNGATGTFTFNVQLQDGTARDKAYVASADRQYEVRVSSANQSVWYSITPQVSGQYTFESRYAEGYDPNVKLYQGNGVASIAANDNISSSDKNFRLQYNLVAGTTYYLEVKNGANSYSGSFDMYVIGIPGSASGNAIQATLGTLHDVNIVYAGQTVWFEYTPAQTGNYVIASSNYTGNIDPVFVLPNSNVTNDVQNISNTDLNFTWTRTMVAGETYYYGARLNSSSDYEQTGSYKFSITVAPGASRDNPVIVENNVAYTVLAGTTDTVTWYAFTPATTQEYTIYTSGITGGCDPYVVIYQGNTIFVANNDDGGNNHFRSTVELTAGETYYIAASLTRGSSTGSYNLVVSDGTHTGESRATARIVFANTPYALTFSGGSSSSSTNSNSIWLEFTPTASGSYCLASSNTSSSFDDDMKIYVGSNSSNNSDLSDTQTGHINKTVTLSAGTTYYIELYIYHGTGSFTFTITKN